MIKKLFKPFETINSSNKGIIFSGWLLILIGFWIYSSLGSIHLFPTPKQVITGLRDLWSEGLMVHMLSSIWLCIQAVFISVLISLVFAYSAPIPFFKPIGLFISKLRYLPLTGISFYVAIVINDARTIQVWVLVVFLTTYLTTSLIQVISDISEDEFDHARTLGLNRYEMLWEVVIKGRFDYVLEMVRENFAIVWMFVVTVESILVAAGGLGVLIKNNDKLGDNGKVIALQFIIILIGVSFDIIITRLRKLIFRYSNF